MSSSDYSPLRVVLWGPPSSGKTCLINALKESLMQFRQPCLEFSFEEIQGNPDKRDLDRVRFGDNLLLWQLGRTPPEHADSTCYDKGIAMTVSSHQHLVEICESIGMEESQPYSHSSSFADANLVILTLDPTLLNTFVSPNSEPLNSSPVPQATKVIDLSEFVRKSIFYGEIQARSVRTTPAQDYAQITQAAYVKYIKKCPGILQNHNLCVVVCITKTDRLPLNERHLDPRELLRKYFGEEMERIFNPELRMDGIRIFVVSISDLEKQSQGTERLYTVMTLRRIFLEMLQDREYSKLKSGSIFLRGENLKNYIPYLEDEGA